MTSPLARVTLATGGAEVPTTRVRWHEPPIVLSSPPKAEIDVLDPSGVWAKALTIGTEVVIRRAGKKEFPGLVVTPIRSVETSDGFVTRAKLTHKGYHFLRRRICDPYVYDEDGKPETTRDAVVVNPWRWATFRKKSGTLDALGQGTALDGVNRTDAVRAMLGTRAVFQIDFRDNAFFRKSTIAAATNQGQVAQEDGDERPGLFSNRKAAGKYAAWSNFDESVPLMNGDPNVDPMGAISAVSFVLLGTYSSGDDPVLEVCRNARDGTRTFFSVSLSRTDNYLGSGLAKWTGSFSSFTGTPSNGPAFGFRIRTSGADDRTTATKIRYLKAVATTAADTGLTEGTLDAYADDGDSWVEDDFEGMTRDAALERIRRGTVSSSSANPSPHWDFWVDANLAAHFKERRGTRLTQEAAVFTVAKGNAESVEWESFGEDLAFQTIGVGGGKGEDKIVVVDKTEFASGGLYDANRDPSGGTRLYGDSPRVLYFRDESLKSPTEVKLRARAFHKQRRDPREFVRATVRAAQVPEFETGDEIKFKESRLGLNAFSRVVSLERDVSPEGEKLTLELGEKLDDVGAAMRAAAEAVGRGFGKDSPATRSTGIMGPGVPFDATHYGRSTFAVPEGLQVERAFLHLATVPWMTMARTSKAGSAHSHTVTIPSHTHDVTLPSHTHDVTLPSHTHDVTLANHTHSIPAPTIAGDVADTTIPTTGSTAFSKTDSVGASVASGATKDIEDLTSTEVSLTSLDGIWIEAEFRSTSNTDWRLEVLVRTRDAVPNSFFTRIHMSEFASHSDTTHLKFFVPMGLLAVAGLGYTHLTGVRLQIKNLDASSRSYSYASVLISTIPRHKHAKGGLVNDSVTSAGGGGTTVTSAGGGGTTVTSAAGGGTTVTSAGGGATTPTSSAESSHTHGLDHGPFVFGGDSDTAGNGPPKFGEGIKFAIDPTVDSAGEPTAFATERVPIVWGTEAAPEELLVDVTPYLRAEANGVVKSGPHYVYLLGTATAANSKGLAVVAVTPILKFKESGR